MKNVTPKKILITSGRSPVALDLARQFHGGGHEVMIAETMRLHVCRFSNSVSKSFKIPSPRVNTELFIQKLIEIAEREKVDLIVPVYEEIIYLAKEVHRFPAHCKIFSPVFDLLNEVHNKWLFNKKIASMGLDTPKTFLIKSPEDLKKLDLSKTYALKACYSRAALGLKKIVPGKPLPEIQIQANNPWIAQEWLTGQGYCTYSVCQEGKVLAHAVYPVGFTVDGHGCLAFEAVDHPGIKDWVEKFAKETNFTGQFAFDFIETEDKLYSIECNPRATSGAHLFNLHDRLDLAFLNETKEIILPKAGNKKQLAIAMAVYGWRKSAKPNNSFTKFFKEFLGVKDVVFNARDLLPILAQPFIFSGIWLKSLRFSLNLPAFFMYDYEWNGEASPQMIEGNLSSEV